jgi:hypothetical protein
MGNSSQRSLTGIKIFRFPHGMMGRRVRGGDSRIGHHIYTLYRVARESLDTGCTKLNIGCQVTSQSPRIFPKVKEKKPLDTFAYFPPIKIFMKII